MNILKYFGQPFLFLLIALGGLAGFRFLKRRKAQPTDINATADKINPSKEVQKIARDLAHNLGTAYFFLHFRNWTENDKEVYDLLKDLTQAEFDQVSKLYNQVFAIGNDLKSDLNRLLDKEFKDKISLL
jgi:hypothetical protein